MINKLKPKSEFNRNILTLMSGTTIAQAIPIAISPILTRIYTPNDFGVLALFLAITSIFASIANGRYELAIMLPKKDEDAINIFALGFIINCFISLLLLILVVIFNNYFTKLLGNNEISFWLYFVPITVFIVGLFNILNYFNTRKKNYKDIKNATILKSIVLAIAQLSLGFIKSGVSGLILGNIISNGFANIKLAKNILKNKRLILKIKLVKIIILAKKYKDFPKYNLISDLSNTLTLQIPFFVIPKVFNITVSGYFFFAQKMISIPSLLIANSISQVFFEKISENNKNNIKNMPIFLNILKKLLMLSLPMSIFIYLFSPTIFEIIFGKEWRISGEISQYLAIIFFFTFIVSTLSITLVSYNKLKFLAIWQYLYLFSSIVFFFLVYYLELEFNIFLEYYVLHQVVLYLIYFFIIFLVVYKMDESIS
ncbi:oligosaccharide flippase family protein [Arcobacter aquimarinus]|nr:oligosaccharide flippase family protein [Arcobacter aquimarinus]